MNKKAYINPELEVIKVQTQQMLALSNPGIDKVSDPISPGGADSPSFDTDPNMFGF